MPAQEIILPNDRILIYGEATRVEMKVGVNATLAKMVPGALVILDAAEGSVMETAGKDHGILGIIDVDPTHSLGDPYDDGPGLLTPGEGENIPILIPNEGSFVLLYSVASNNLIMGDRLVAADDGLVDELAAATMGGQGDIVGLCWDTHSAAAITAIVVRWCYTPEAQVTV